MNLKKIKLNGKKLIRSLIILILICIIVIKLLPHEKNYLKIIEQTRLDESNVTGEVKEVSMYSDNEVIAINLGNTYWMFYELEGEKVSSLLYYYEYENEEKAKIAANEYLTTKNLNSVDEEKFEEVTQKGRYVILKPLQTAFESTTRQDVLDMYVVLEEFYHVAEE